MNRWELFVSLTDLDDDIIIEATQEQHIASNARRLYIRIIAIAAIISILSISAGAVISRIQMEITPLRVRGWIGETYTIKFKSTDYEPVKLGRWYPDYLPDGYQFANASTDEFGFQQLVFVRDEARIILRYCIPRFYEDDNTFLNPTISNVKQMIETKVNNSSAYYFSTPDLNALFWMEESRGIAFHLYCDSLDYNDLIRIAESLLETDELLNESINIHADAALVKLGDYQPQSLPDGYELYDIYGLEVNVFLNPNEYGYVHKVYYNDLFARIDLYYEHLPIRWESQVIPSDLPNEEVEINGSCATLYYSSEGNPYALQWIYTDIYGFDLTFSLIADKLSQEDLIQTAQSISCIVQANTDHYKR